MLKKIILILVFLYVALMALLIYCLPEQVKSEYYTTMSVDKTDKIENAISNVVSDLTRRDFVPVKLEVDWHPVSKTYVIYVSGIDRAKLCRYEP